MSELPFKVGAAYNVFDGTELLEASIRSIRPLVSYVVVVYQTSKAFDAPLALKSTIVVRSQQLWGGCPRIAATNTRGPERQGASRRNDCIHAACFRP